MIRSVVVFLLAVVSGFRKNQGVLLSGAVAYYTLGAQVIAETERLRGSPASLHYASCRPA